MKSSWTGDRAYLSLQKFFGEVLDYHVAIFTTREAAEACRERRNEQPPAIVVPLQDGLWTLIAGNQVFATEAEAAGAARSWSTLSGHVVTAWRGGWLALPAGLAVALAP